MTGISVFNGISGGAIFNNKISDIKQTNTTGWGSNGIGLFSTSTASGLNVYNNFISDVASQGFNGTTATDNGYGIMINSGGGYNIYFNTVVLNKNQGAGAASGITAALSIVGQGSGCVSHHIFIIIFWGTSIANCRSLTGMLSRVHLLEYYFFFD
ncbi:MAG: hypothetical protein IPP39_01355 [Chitinophagaceae bacterium]|nr:hypothetical protein [Chitinophagaceae bacterium]